MARRQDAAVGAVGHHGEVERVLAGQHGEARGLARQQLERLGEAARTVLHAHDVGHLGELEQRVVREVHRRAIGDVVDHHVAVGRRGDGAEVRDQPVLARPVVVGADRDDALEGRRSSRFSAFSTLCVALPPTPTNTGTRPATASVRSTSSSISASSSVGDSPVVPSGNSPSTPQRDVVRRSAARSSRSRRRRP